jgi:hypothetical protein
VPVAGIGAVVEGAESDEGILVRDVFRDDVCVGY